jgi:hypothetical protein
MGGHLSENRKAFASHKYVTHGIGEYVHGDVHVNLLNNIFYQVKLFAQESRSTLATFRIMTSSPACVIDAATRCQA